MDTKVIKRDGTFEEYDEAKVMKVAVACGLEAEQAKTMSQDITKWMKSHSVPTVTSLQIRDAFLENLKKVNKSAADLYVWYESSKDGPNENSS